jgi:hypothetical protein
VKRWTQWILRIGFSLAMILAGYTWGHHSVSVVYAQQATTQVNMPKGWGPLIGTMTGVLVFQDRTGTIRLVSADTGAVAELITRN